MSAFYSDHQTLTRGFASQHTIPDSAALQYFVKMVPGMEGMGVNPNSGAQEFKAIFDEYNLDLARSPEKLEQRLIQHSMVKKGYWISHLVSFSHDLGRVAQEFASGDMMLPEFKRAMKSRIVLEARDRKVAALDTCRNTPVICRTGYPLEHETVLIGGVDPESMKSVVIEDIQVTGREEYRKSGSSKDPLVRNVDYVIKRTRTFTRESWNRVRLTETIDGKTSREVEYELQPDGNFKEIR